VEVSRDPTHPRSLDELGISRDQSSRWQQLAKVPEEQFESSLRAPDRSQGGRLVSPAPRRWHGGSGLLDYAVQEVAKCNQVTCGQYNAGTHHRFEIARSVSEQGGSVWTHMRECQRCQRTKRKDVELAITNRFRNIAWIYYGRRLLLNYFGHR
jgi:hypothetical protein